MTDKMKWVRTNQKENKKKIDSHAEHRSDDLFFDEISQKSFCDNDLNRARARFCVVRCCFGGVKSLMRCQHPSILQFWTFFVASKMCARVDWLDIFWYYLLTAVAAAIWNGLVGDEVCSARSLRIDSDFRCSQQWEILLMIMTIIIISHFRVATATAAVAATVADESGKSLRHLTKITRIKMCRVEIDAMDR